MVLTTTRPHGSAINRNDFKLNLYEKLTTHIQLSLNVGLSNIGTWIDLEVEANQWMVDQLVEHEG